MQVFGHELANFYGAAANAEFKNSSNTLAEENAEVIAVRNHSLMKNLDVSDEYRMMKMQFTV